MIESIIAFLTTNKAAIGALVSIGEGIIVLFNLWRKFRSNSRVGVESMSAPTSKLKAFLWVINPISLFRKPK